MAIPKIKFPLYGILIVSSLFIASIYIAISLKKKGYTKDIIFYFILMFLSFSLIGGLMLTHIIEGQGISSYEGAFYAIISAFVMEKIIPSKNNDYMKATVLSLPLVYSIGKIGCFIAGCCYGLPYNGIFSVTYIDDLNIPLVPIQLIESIIFFLLFIILNHYKDKYNNYIIELTIIVCAMSKFMTDFLRYNHLEEIISKNQIISIIFIFISVFFIVKKRSNVKTSSNS